MNFDADGSVYGHDRDAYKGTQSSPAPPRSLEDQYPAAATAAVALAQLHSHQPHSDWDSEAVITLLSLSTEPRMATDSCPTAGLRL